MSIAISDLSYDLMTMVRTYDRANDFTRADEYRALLARVEEQEQEFSDLLNDHDNLEDLLSERVHELQVCERNQDANQRLLNTIAGIARDALASTEDRDDIDDNEAALLDALSNILSHAEA